MPTTDTKTARPAFAAEGSGPAPTGPGLSPWPGTPEAVELLRPHVQGGQPGNDERIAALGRVASAMVEREAPDAPQAIKNEAVIRFAGYLGQSDFGTIVSETSVGSNQVEYVVTHQNAWRNSGAAMLLSDWVVRRAVLI